MTPYSPTHTARHPWHQVRPDHPTQRDCTILSGLHHKSMQTHLVEHSQLIRLECADDRVQDTPIVEQYQISFFPILRVTQLSVSVSSRWVDPKGKGVRRNVISPRGRYRVVGSGTADLEPLSDPSPPHRPGRLRLLSKRQQGEDQ